MQRRNRKIAIIGAGFAGRGIARELSEKGIFGDVHFYLDDAPEKIGTSIDGVPVFGPLEKASRYITDNEIDEAIIAIPSAPQERLREVYTLLKETAVPEIRLLPGLAQVIDGEAHLIQAKEISSQDLLARDPVPISLKESLRYLRGRRVLITGAGGSIGSELARQLLYGGAERLYLLDHGENSLYEIDSELRLLQEEGVGEKATIVPIVGELQDKAYVDFLLQRLKADVIFHCAAYKHVPMMEANPVEVIKNNVYGTQNLVEASRRRKVEKLVLISTDKAVDPVSIYGVSKLLAEGLLLHSAATPDTSRMVVRFGNVIGSRGSIVPLFRKQILKGGPVTLTHPDMKRYFMTIPEAASLVLKTGGVGSNGNLYILDMGEPVKIRELAEQMIRFHGFIPGKEIAIKTIGLRAGEKLLERLWTEHEKPVPSGYDGILKVEGSPPLLRSLPAILEELRPICFFSTESPGLYRNRKQLKLILRQYFPKLVVPDDEPEY